MLVPSVFGRNVFDDFFDDLPMMPLHTQQSAVMKTDVKETENGYEIAVDLPGVKKEDVKAKLNDGYLTISATTSSSNDDKDKNGKYIRRERYSGSYSRSFYVGETLKEEDIKAKFDNGVLMLDIPKPELKAPEKAEKFIAIQ